MKEQAIKSSFQLLSHCVEELDIKNKIFILDADDSKTFKKTLKDVSIKDANMHEDSERFWGNLSLFISIQCKSKSNSRKTICVKIKISGMFTGEKGSMDKEQFQNMLITNGSASLYSMARAIITTTTSQCLPSGHVTLPMVNVFQLLNSINVSFKTDETSDAAESE